MFPRILISTIAVTTFVAGCSGSSVDDVAQSPGSSAVTKSTVVVGAPNPALPAEINPIPYKPGDLVALGNAEVRIGVPEQTGNVFSFEVSITSGSLASFAITSDMFRVYTVDGASYTPEATNSVEQFGNATIEPSQTYTGTVTVTLAGDSEPAMFVVDMSTSGERVMPGAWVFDPDFSPDSPEG